MSQQFQNIINLLQNFWSFTKSDFWTTVLFIFGPVSIIFLSVSLKSAHLRLVSFSFFLFWLISSSILFSTFLSNQNYHLDTLNLIPYQPSPTPSLIDEDYLFNYLNQKRIDLNISPLATSDQLCLFTQTRLNQLLSNQTTLDKSSYPQNLLVELYFTKVVDSDTAISLIDKDFTTNKYLFTNQKSNQTIDIACLKVGQTQDGYIILLVLGSNQKPTSSLKNLAPRPTDDSTPWGQAVQIDEHTWTMKVQNDDRMSTVEELFTALNDYRRTKGVPVLTWDQKLADYATSRAKYFTSIKTTDGHAGFNDFLTNQDGFNKLGFTQLGENTSYGYRMLGVHLIEWIYAGDEPHDKNQRNSIWSHVGIGIDGVSTCLIFATGKF